MASKKSRIYVSQMRKAVRAMEKEMEALRACSLQQELLIAIEQVLVDTILQHSDLSKFRESFEQHECAAAAAGLQENADSSEPGHSSSEGTAAAGPQQQLSPHADLLQQHTPVLQDACCDAAPYVTRLLHTIQHSTVQQVLSWQADDWHVFFSATAAELSLKLQMLASDAANSHHHHQQQHKQQHTAAAAAAAAAPHMDVVQQQFCQAVDRLAASGLVGAIFGDRIGHELGVCTSTNHITVQQEAPPPGHWQRVLLQLQPTQPQLLHLAAGFHEFARMRKAQQAAQLALSAQITCSNSCSLQVLAAANSQSDSTKQAQHGADASAKPSGALAACSGSAENDAASSERDTVTAVAAPPEACSSLADRLLRTLNQSFLMAQVIMLNTLTQHQIAQLVVSSFPYVPRAAPLMEAALEVLSTKPSCAPTLQQMMQATAAAYEDTSAASAAELAAGGIFDRLFIDTQQGPGLDQYAAAATAAAAAAAAAGGSEEKLTGIEQAQVHMQQRMQTLQQQVQQWWHIVLLQDGEAAVE